mgnify:FL=1
MKRTRFRPLILGAAWSIFLAVLMLFGAPPKLVGALSLPLLGLAVDPTSRRPGVGIKVNLRSGTSTQLTGAQRILLLSTKNASGGSATVETVIYEAVANADAVATLAGAGGLAHLAAKRLFEEYPTATVDCLFMAAASGDSAAGTITFDDTTPVSSAQTVTIKIAGYSFALSWNAAETDVDFATRVVAKIGTLSKFLPVTATNGAGTLAVVTLTFKQKGKAGLDCTYSAALSEGVGGAVSTAAARLTGGTTEPDPATALLAMVGKEWRFILPCISNADMALASATGTMGKLKTYIAANDTGIGALLQTAHTACTDSTANAKAMSNQHDFEYFSHHLARGAQSLPCEWAGAAVGAYARESKIDPAHPFVQQELVATLVGSADTATDDLTVAEQEDLLASGVSYFGRTAQGVPRFERPISTYFEDADGNADDRVLDISKTFALVAVGSDLRTFCQRTFKGKKLMKNLPSGNTPIPPGIVEEKDAKGLIVGRIRSQWVPAGVIRGDKLDEVIADGSLVVQVDPLDETQLDVFLPLRVVPPLVKTSIDIVQA